MFRNIVTLYSEELLAPRRTPKLEDHSLSAVRDCLVSTYIGSYSLYLKGVPPPQPEDEPCCGDMTDLSRFII